MKPIYSSIIALVCGAIFSFGFPSFWGYSNPLFSFIGIGGWFYLFHYKSQPWLHSWLFALGFNLAGFYWIPHTLHEFGELPWWLSYFLGIFFSFIILPQIWAINILNYILKKYNKNNFGAFVWASSLYFFEQYIPQQFPTHIGHTLLPLGKWLGASPYIGEPGYSFVSLFFIFSVVIFIVERKKPITSTLCFIGVLLFGMLKPLYLSKEGTPLYLRIVQANIGNLLKLSSEDGHQMSVYQVMDLYKDLSLSPYHVENRTTGPDLTIWPETAYPLGMDFSSLSQQSPIAEIFRELTEKTKSQFFFGGYDETKPQDGKPAGFETDFNSGFHVNEMGHPLQSYHKQILIPFGETLPFGPLNYYLAKTIGNIAFFGKGKKWSVFQTKNKSYFITPICYEILLTAFIRDYLNNGKEQANFIVNLTNDSWYGNTAEPEQHLFLAKWRALEFQLPIIRSTNTGITSVIYSDGSESKRLNIGERKNLDIKIVTNNHEKTLYQSWGTMPLNLLILLFLSFFTLKFLSKKNNYIPKK